MMEKTRGWGGGVCVLMVFTWDEKSLIAELGFCGDEY